MDRWIPLANFIVQCVLAAVVVWYTVETRRLRTVAQEQVEGLQKPCITFSSSARDQQAAILEMGGAVGDMIAGARDGNLVAHNMGSGSALKIRYRFTRLNPSEGTADNRGPNGYVAIIPAGDTFALHVSREHARNREFEVRFTYDSLTGQQYVSVITLAGLVITDFHFRQVAR